MLLRPEVNDEPTAPGGKKRTYVFVIGTRAQLIKVAPVLVACEKSQLDCLLLMTGQHKETMQDLVDEFGIQSKQTFAIPAAEHSTVSSLIRWLPAAYLGVTQKLKEIFAANQDIDVLVHGDTLSTLIGAFAGYRCGARVVHLESGLTSGKLLDPFPEEICRRLVFRLTDIAICPDETSAKHMARYKKAQIFNSHGNSILDAVLLTGAADVAPNESAPYVVVSLHRFQNIYNAQRLKFLVNEVASVAKHLKVHFILHPATRGRLEKEGLTHRLESNENIHLSGRMGYRDFIRLAAGSSCVLTDGGSNQEELAFLGVPTVIMRAHTERLDGLGATAMMESDIAQGLESYIANKSYMNVRVPVKKIEGDTPSQRIVKRLIQPV